MIRKMLACLALLTGLTAAGAPVQAEVAISLVSRIEASVKAETAPAAAGHAPVVVARQARFGVTLPAAARAEGVFSQATVRLSDRARE